MENEYERDAWGRAGKLLRVVETVEPEFDADERDSWYALWEWEQATCPQCGNLRVICSDPDQPWFPQRHVCWATAAREVVTRTWWRKHEKAQPDTAGYLPTDGATVWVSSEDLTPDDDFLD